MFGDNQVILAAVRNFASTVFSENNLVAGLYVKRKNISVFEKPSMPYGNNLRLLGFLSSGVGDYDSPSVVSDISRRFIKTLSCSGLIPISYTSFLTF